MYIFSGDFISATNLNSILSSFTASVSSLSKAIKDQPVSSSSGGINPNAGEVISFVCDLLITLQTSNRLCWQVDESQEVLLALFSLDVSMSKGKNNIIKEKTKANPKIPLFMLKIQKASKTRHGLFSHKSRFYEAT